MAKASVTMICPDCGAEFVWSAIKGNRRDADAWERWASGQHRQCPECYRRAMAEQRERDRADALDSARISAAELGLVELIGSDKQIAWAMQIRANAYNDICPESATAVYRNAVLGEINAHVDAKWWIDHRGGDAVGYIKGVAQEAAIRALPDVDKEQLLSEARKLIGELSGIQLTSYHLAILKECELILKVLG